MELKSLRLFVEVAESGSFVTAAERSHTVQSNVTAHIKKLESELGAQLFNRKGGISLTGAGNTLVDYVRESLKLIRFTGNHGWLPQGSVIRSSHGKFLYNSQGGVIQQEHTFG